MIKIEINEIKNWTSEAKEGDLMIVLDDGECKGSVLLKTKIGLISLTWPGYCWTTSDPNYNVRILPKGTELNLTIE